MTLSFLVMLVGFCLAAYSVVGNDVIQTLGTFLTSNERKVKWYTLWGFASTVLVSALVYGYATGDISYGRLSKFTAPEIYHWYYIIPPLVLMLITRIGIPVSTTFMILTLFSLDKIPAELGQMMNSVFDTEQKLGGMIQKSMIGYIIASTSALAIYLIITKFTEQYFIKNKLNEASKEASLWTGFQWFTTGFLWFQWLTQDLANIYIYLNAGRDMSIPLFVFSLLVFVLLLGYIFYQKGGKVQNVVRSKINTRDIRSATLIDLIYGIILYLFKYNLLGLFEAKLPMSTTWVFVGLLSGRELGIRLMSDKKLSKKIVTMVFADLGKIFFGLLVSIVIVFIIKFITSLYH